MLKTELAVCKQIMKTLRGESPAFRITVINITYIYTFTFI